MMKKIVFTAFVMFTAAIVAMAQTDPAPKNQKKTADKSERMENAKSTKEADKIEHAEERSGGAAFSGKGKGGDKDQVEKEKKGKKGNKGKAKGKGKGKDKAKGKSKDKSKGNKEQDNDGDDDNRGKKEKDNKGAERKRDRDREQTGSERTPGTKPAPTEPKSRKPGDKPTPGTENPKGQKTGG